MPILICPCPDLKFDAQALVAQLSRKGLEVRLTPRLCTPAGLAELRQALATGPEQFLIAACGPEVNAGLFQRLWGDACPPLDLADAGHQVYLVDSSLSIGGTMAQLDKTFPTLDCSICILGPRLVEAATHPNIELLTYVDLGAIRGRAGAFEVDLTLRPRYVDMAKCVGCGACAEVCPVIVPSRWNLGLKPRKCIRIVFAQAVPLRSTLEREYCIDCQMCVAACDRQAIDLEARPVERRLLVGAIILATGARPLDPSLKSEYGYGRLPRVITALEYERLVEAMLALEHNPEAQVTVFFNDIRTSGKGFEDLYLRAQKAGVRFVKGLPGRLEADDSGRPVIHYEDQLSGRRRRLTVDLAVLAVGLAPPPEIPAFEDDGPERDAFGFFRGRHPTLKPLASTLPGVFLAGTCQGPQDISETVCQGSAAAAQVMQLLSPKNQNASNRP